MKRVLRFFEDSYGELKKVIWPSREEVIASTKVVIVSIVLLSLALGLVDLVLFWGLDFLF